jgi:hypothetical protein
MKKAQIGMYSYIKASQREMLFGWVWFKEPRKMMCFIGKLEQPMKKRQEFLNNLMVLFISIFEGANKIIGEIWS